MCNLLSGKQSTSSGAEVFKVSSPKSCKVRIAPPSCVVGGDVGALVLRSGGNIDSVLATTYCDSSFTNMASPLGQFLSEEDLDEANRLSKQIQFSDLDEYEKVMIRNLLEFNWDSEPQMISNLLHFPHIMPDDKRLKLVIKGLREDKQPYYNLAAAAGVGGMKLQGSETEELIDILKGMSTHQHGMVAVRAFMTLAELLKHPADTSFVLKFMYKSKSNLRYNSLDWLLENVKDRSELLSLLADKCIPEDVREESTERVKMNTFELDGRDNSSDLHQLTFIPNLADYEAMRTKEQTLAELFTELDSDHDGLISALELKEFCEDIGQDLTLERAANDIATVDGDKDGKIDTDEWIELMFPRFNIQ